MSDDKPTCGCHDEINAAVKAHAGVVEQVIHNPSLNIPSAEMDEARSDALVALWKALLAFDPAKMNSLGAFLRIRLTQRVIDGLRTRGVDSRHSEETNRAKRNVQWAASIDGMRPSDAEALWVDGSEWSDYTTQSDVPDRILALAWHIDEDLPIILRYVAAGFKHTEVKAATGIAGVSQKIQKFRKYTELFPDLQYRPEFKYISREWRQIGAN